MLIVIENVLERAEVLDFRRRLAAADWAGGEATAGTRSVAVKQNSQLTPGDQTARELGETILARLGHTPQFVSASLAERIFPPVFNRYRDGGHYGTHVDSALMRIPGEVRSLRSDLSATLFLSDPEDYDGGELVIEGEFGGQAIKLAAGDMVLYPSSSLHQVTPVTRGERICAITWIESAVADASARAMLYDLDQAIQALAPRHEIDDPDVDRLVHVYHNLVRRWARP